MNALLEPAKVKYRVLETIDRHRGVGEVVTAVGAEIRKKPFMLFMTTVAALASFYYFLLAAPLYESKVEFALRGKQAVPTVPLLAALAGQVSSGVPEITALSNYIKSTDTLNELDKRHKLRQLYSSFRPDFLYWMPSDASQDRFLDFYNGMVAVDFDTDANLITVSVSSFDPNSAQAIANSILQLSSKFVDNLSREMRDESIQSAKNDFQIAQTDALQARLAVTRFRSTTGDLDPSVYGSGAAAQIMAMQTEIAKLKTQLAALQTYNTANSPQVQQLQAMISSFENQVAQSRTKLASQGTADTVATQINQYQGLAAKQDYAEKRLVAAQAALDQAKSVAEQRELFVVPITHPLIPDRSTKPRRLISVLSILLVAAVLYAIAALALASIRDHQGL